MSFSRLASLVRQPFAVPTARRTFAMMSVNVQSAAQDIRRRRVTLIPGDGIGPECTNSVVQVLAAMKAPVDWESYSLACAVNEPTKKDRMSKDLKESIRKNGFALKGPLITPKPKGIISPDIMMAREFGLFAHVVPVKNVPSVKTRHDNVDMVIIRENTEGEYSGLEHEVNPGVQQDLGFANINMLVFCVYQSDADEYRLLRQGDERASGVGGGRLCDGFSIV